MGRVERVSGVLFEQDTSEECKNARTELLPPPPALHKSSLAAKGEKGSAKSNTTIERRSTADDPDTSNSSYLSKYDSYQNTLIKKIRTTTSASVQTSICTATSQASVPYGVRFQGEASLIYPYRAGSTEDGIHAAGDDSYCACDTDEGIRPTTPVVSSLNSETSSTGSVITSDIGSLVSSLASQAPTLIPNVPSIVSSIAFSAASVVESEVSSILVPASSTTPVPSAEISSILSSIQSSLQSELSTILPTSSGILPPPSALCSRPFVPISAAADDDGNCDVLGDKPSMVLGPVSETDGFERATQPSAKESVSIEYGIPEGRHEHTTEPLGFVNDISQTRFGVEKTELRTTPNLTALIKALLNRSEAATTCERKKLL
ncbi:hypothetical protein K469DRAFT_319107 [Zopfia rhizophila CBS 207.26]|uniref:Uncharacterized protein n=1 Tax=Zopfia rhizophila CBS 207.26 TaxID=1314779 RepID=A0A6A6EKU0_9PEZI|nr:hypothetical protein K469DRAFT_319107 [Zopfia rhizophila CBS 207.26]